MYRGQRPAAEYLLYLVTPHSRVRINSTNANQPWVRKMVPVRRWIHPADAAKRGIKVKDRVIVKNATGSSRVAVLITEDITEGVWCASIKGSGWHMMIPVSIPRVPPTQLPPRAPRCSTTVREHIRCLLR